MKTLVAASLLILGSARISAAQGINLFWNDCGPFGGLHNVSFACNTDGRTFTLVGSFYAPTSVLAASGIVSAIFMRTYATTTWPAWWGMAPGLCRAGSLSADFDFTGDFNCVDHWQGAAAGGVVMDSPSGNGARLTVTAALPAGSPLIAPIPQGDEVYAFKLVIDAAKTTGAGSCTGCFEHVDICLNYITITQPAGTPGGDRYIGVPAVSSSVTWQGPTGTNPLCEGTPARNTTWGSIKSLYR